MFLRRKGSEPNASKSRPLSEGSSSKELPRGCGVLFFGLFLLAGLGVSYPILVKPITGLIAARSWIEVPAVVVSSDVVGDGDSYRVAVSYRYTYQGREYVSDRYGFIEFSTSGYKGKAAVVKSLPPGRRVTCYVDPGAPATAVLSRKPSAALFFGLLPLVFVAIGGGGVYYSLKKPSPKPPGLPSSTGTWSPGRASAEPALRTPGGELRPRVSRRGKLLGLILIAAFWNGLISFFVIHVVSEWQRGDIPWFLTLFLMPFLLVGLALIGGVMHSLLGLFNPTVRLSVTEREIPLGGTLHLSWTLDGKAERLRNFRITLEGSEHATYRRGTDTRTDQEVFTSISLVEASHPAEAARGSVECKVPPEAMHTFKSKNNEVRWTLHVRGEISRWPDIHEEYPVIVHPRAPSSLRHSQT